MKELIKKLKIKIAQIYILNKNKQLPFYAKVFAVFTIIYALSPIDLIPDFIPVIGYLDDLIILPILVYFTLLFIPKNRLEAVYEEALTLTGKMEKKRTYSLLIVFIWIMLFTLILLKCLK